MYTLSYVRNIFYQFSRSPLLSSGQLMPKYFSSVEAQEVGWRGGHVPPLILILDSQLGSSSA